MLKKFGIAFLVFIVLFVVISFVLPAKIHVERAITINAKPEAIYPYVSNFEKFNTWSPRAKLDPNTKYIYEGEGVELEKRGPPRGRGMGLMIEKMLAPDYEKGLKNLKEIVEKP